MLHDARRKWLFCKGIELYATLATLATLYPIHTCESVKNFVGLGFVVLRVYL